MEDLQTLRKSLLPGTLDYLREIGQDPLARSCGAPSDEQIHDQALKLGLVRLWPAGSSAGRTKIELTDLGKRVLQ
jgi:hypothetical protein